MNAGRLLLISIGLTGAAVVTVGWTMHHALSITFDSVHFIRHAQRLQAPTPIPIPADATWLDHGRARWPILEVIRTEHHHPGFPALVALTDRWLTERLTPDVPTRWTWACRWTCAAGFVAVVLLSWGWARALTGSGPSWLIGLIVALAPPLVRMGADGLSDSWALAGLLASAWATQRCCARPSVHCGSCVGLTAGIGYWFRPEAAQVGLACLLVCLIGILRPGEQGRRAWLRASLGLVTVLSMFLVPLMALKGSMFTKKAHLFESASAERSTPPAGRLVLTQWKTQSPPTPARRSWTQGMRTFVQRWSSVVGHFWLVPTLIGMTTAVWRSPTRPTCMVVGLALANWVGLAWVLYVWSGYLDNRHVMPTALLTLPWAGVGLQQMTTWCWSLAAPADPEQVQRRRRWSMVVTAGLALAPMLWVTLQERLNRQRVGIRLAGEHLRRLMTPSNEVLDLECLAAFYADALPRNRWVLTPTFTLDQLQQVLDAHTRIRFVVASDPLLAMYGLSLEEFARRGQLQEIATYPLSTDRRDHHQVHLFEVRRGFFALRQ